MSYTQIGRFQIVGQLGQGGMGVVYKAFDPQIERFVAIKVISAQMLDREDLRERFFREARAAGQLTHRNIVVVHDLGEHDGQPYIAMEFVEGRTLDVLLARKAPLPLGWKLDVVMDVCEGLAFAHGRGIVHRDIKPANIMVPVQGPAKILDFGLARLVTSDLTKSHTMLGTMNYMAPEQIQGQSVDHRADIFALGVVLYELLTGRRAFEGDSFGSTIYKVLQEHPAMPLSQFAPGLPDPLDAIVARALAKDREARYQHAADLHRDLLDVRGRLSQPSDLPTMAFGLPGPMASGAVRLDEVTVAREPTANATGTPAPWRPRTPLPSPAPSTPVPAVPAPPNAPAAPSAEATARRARSGLLVAGLALVVIAAAGAWWTRPARSGTPREADVAEATSEPIAGTRVPAAVSPVEPAATGGANPTSPAPAAAPVAPTPPAPAPLRNELRDDPRPRVESAASRAGADAAERRALEARARADTAGASQHAPAAWGAAERRHADARALVARRDYAAAVDRFTESGSLFEAAALEAERQRAALGAQAREEADRRSRDEQLRRAETARGLFEQRRAEAAAAGAPARAAEEYGAGIQQGLAAQGALDRGDAVLATRDFESAAGQLASARQLAIEAAARPPAPVVTPPAEPVEAALQRYIAALEGRNLAALKRVWPTLTGAAEQAIKAEFDNAEAIDVSLDSPRVQVSGDTATVVCRRHYRVQTRDGQRLRSDTTTTMQLRRTSATWSIESITHERAR